MHASSPGFYIPCHLILNLGHVTCDGRTDGLKILWTQAIFLTQERKLDSREHVAVHPLALC